MDHTADVGLRIRAADLVTLLRDAATGMFSVIHEGSMLRPAKVNTDATDEADSMSMRDSIEIEAPAADQLLHAWLTELLFHHTIFRSLPCSIGIESCASTQLRAQVRWIAMDEDTIAEATEIKAVTWHGLLVEERDGVWTAEVIFDT